MYQTPYELLLRKSRERKKELTHTIKQNNLKLRSISYDVRVSNDSLQNPEAKTKKREQPEKHKKMNFTSCIKKSFYYRKFLNQTGERQLTSEGFHRFKETFDKIGIHHSLANKNPSIYREIWENQIQRKYSLRTDEEREPELIIVPRRSGDTLEEAHLNGFEAKKNNEENRVKMQDISEIAKKRQMSLDFDLQIQGNKKNIKAKDSTLSKSPKKNQNAGLAKEEYKQAEKFYNSSSPVSEKNHQTTEALNSTLNSKLDCNLFKRFQQAIKNQTAEQNNKICIKIKKIRTDKRHLVQDSNPKTPKSSYLQKWEGVRTFRQSYGQREIKSSWNSQYEPYSQRSNKAQTAQKCRISVRRHKKIQPCNYSNDIQGWNVKPENQDQNTQVFGV